MRRVLAVLWILSMSGSACAIEPVDGVMTEKGKDGSGNPVDVEMKIVKRPSARSYEKNGQWGSDKGEQGGRVFVAKNPDRVISSMVVSWMQKEMYVPVSAIMDLGDPREIKVEPTGKTSFALTIRGGGWGASLSYTAVLTFDKGFLVKRKVFSNSFPKERWEETTYSWIPDDGR